MSDIGECAFCKTDHHNPAFHEIKGRAICDECLSEHPSKERAKKIIVENVNREYPMLSNNHKGFIIELKRRRT